MNRRRILTSAAALAACPLLAAAGDGWPAKPVTLVVPSSPGGGTDAFARVLAHTLGEALGQMFIVENKPGASGNLGAEHVARATGDGYTFLLAASAAVVINPALLPKAGFDVRRDLVPVARGVSSPYLLLASPGSKLTTLAELVAKARQEPGRLSFGSAGVGTVPYLGVRMLEEAAGVRFLHVPYKGLAPVFQDLIGGQLDFVLSDLASARPHLGRLVPLALSDRIPLPVHVPTFAEAGLAAVKPNNYFSVLAPASTPPAIVAKMGAEVNAAMRRPAVAARLQQLGLLPVADTPADFARGLQDERAAWGDFIRRNGIKPGD